MSGAVRHAHEQRKSSAGPRAAIEGVTMSSSQSPVKPRLAASERLQNVPPYTLAKVSQNRDEKLRQGVDVIDFGVGNPDIRPPQIALDALQAAISEEDARRAKVLFLNFPNNPTGGTETAEMYDEVLAFARRHDLFVVSDIAYCDLPLDPTYRARSFLQHDRDRERTLEFHSFSKSYSMQGWRLGFAAGNADIVANLTRIKSNMDFGVFMAIQRAGLAVLNAPQDYHAPPAELYRRRGEAFLAALAPLGCPAELPRATLYLWLPIPRGFTTSLEFSSRLLDATGVVVAAGSGFGDAGEGYVRAALCVDEARCREAAERIARAGVRW